MSVHSTLTLQLKIHVFSSKKGLMIGLFIVGYAAIGIFSGVWHVQCSIYRTGLVCKLILDWSFRIFVDTIIVPQSLQIIDASCSVVFCAEVERELIPGLLLFLLRSDSRWGHSQCFGGYYPWILHMWTRLYPYGIQDLHADVTLPSM